MDSSPLLNDSVTMSDSSELSYVKQHRDGRISYVGSPSDFLDADANEWTATRLLLEESIHSRYTSIACVTETTAIISPFTNFRYCYLDSEEAAQCPDEASMCPVIVGDRAAFARERHSRQLKFELTANEWMNLSKIGKADLNRILQFPCWVWSCIEFIDDEQPGCLPVWKKKPAIPLRSRGNLLLLKEYYPDAELKGRQFEKFVQLVTNGLTPEEIDPVKHPFLADAWTAALVGGLGNGDGRTAVYGLFQEIVDLLPHMDITTDVRVFHKMSPSKLDHFLVADTGSTTSSKSCSSSLIHKQLSDLVVLAQDHHTKFAKYIFLVEIHSKGTDPTAVHDKFLKELIWVLQSQTVVFGFLFSARAVKYFCAERFTSGKIEIETYDHMLSFRPDGDQLDKLILSVADFQVLIMDILACLVYGVRHIRV